MNLNGIRRIGTSFTLATLGLTALLAGCGGGSGGVDAAAALDARMDVRADATTDTADAGGAGGAGSADAADASDGGPVDTVGVPDAATDHAPISDASDGGAVTDGASIDKPADTSAADGATQDAPAATDGAAPDGGDSTDAAFVGDAAIDCTWIGDFDGDGTKDCALLRQTAGARGDILFRKGLGGGQYSATQVVSTAIVPVALDFTNTVDVMDLNHDTRDDIIVTSHDLHAPPGTNTLTYVQVFRGKADGTFVASPSPDPFRLGGNATFFNAGFFPKDLRGDFDGDGFVDILGDDGTLAFPFHQEWIVLRSTPGDSLNVVESPTPAGRGLLIVSQIAKMDPGPTDDIVSLLNPTGPTGCSSGGMNGGGVFLYFSFVANFSQKLVTGSEFANSVSLKDLDQDGIPDLIAKYPAGAMTCGGCRQNNTQVFLSSATWAVAPLSTIVLGFGDTPDLNGDGIGDDYRYCDGGPVKLLFNCSFGSCTPTTVTLPGTEAALDLRLVDVNHDNKLDVRLTFVDGQKVFYQHAGGTYSETAP